MGTAERRCEIMRVLCRRRNETVANLAKEFDVSTRTILRDIAALSLKNPIYTQCGRYGGGVYVLENYQMEPMAMTQEELNVLQKVLISVEKGEVCVLPNNDKKIFQLMISKYTKS